MFTPKNYTRALRTKSEIIHMFSHYPECTTLTNPTAEQIDRIRAVQIAGARHGKLGWYPGGDFSSDADFCNGIGAEINALETELECDSGEVFDLYSNAHSAFYRDGTINPNEYGRESCFTFHFGAYGDTHVSIWADHIEDALELAAEWLAEHAPGLLMAHGGPELAELYHEACKETGNDPNDPDIDLEEKCQDMATADLTYTESGYLTSYEWTVDESDTPPGPDASALGRRR